jgi:hypothetical protein
MSTSLELDDDLTGINFDLEPKVHRCYFCEHMSKLQHLAATMPREHLQAQGVSEELIDHLIDLNTRPEWRHELAPCSDDEL